MKLIILYIGVFALTILSFVCILQSRPNPEVMISGEWVEASWEYEKINSPGDLDFKNYSSEQVKNLLGKDLIIYEAKKWEFLPGGNLRLIGNKAARVVNWRIKGRGNILQIKHRNGLLENYNISSLEHDKMILNFDADVKERGIAQLTFFKI